MSPELFNPAIKDHRQTESSDYYAFGMVIYEVLSGHVPYHRHANLVVPAMVIQGIHPQRPKGGVFTDELWKVLERCWTSNPQDRLSIKDILPCLEKQSKTWIPLPPPLEEVSSTSAPSVALPPDPDTAANLLGVRKDPASKFPEVINQPKFVGNGVWVRRANKSHQILP